MKKRNLAFLLIIVLLVVFVRPTDVYADSGNPFVGKWVTSYLYDSEERNNPIRVGDLFNGDVLTKDTAYIEINEDYTATLYFMGEPYPVTYTIDDGKIIAEDYMFVSESDSVILIDAAWGWFCVKETPTPGPAPDPAPTPGHTHNYEWQIINEPSLEADGLEAEVCTICGARRNEQTVSAFGYALYSYGLNKLNGAKSGDTVILEFGEWNSFPKQFMEKVKEKVAAGVTVVFKFNYQHAPYEITIPAYSTVYTNLEWCGPACMYQLYVLKIPVEN